MALFLHHLYRKELSSKPYGGLHLPKSPVETSRIWLFSYQCFTQLSTHQYSIFDRKATKFCKNTPQKAGTYIRIYIYHVNVRTPTLRLTLSGIMVWMYKVYMFKSDTRSGAKHHFGQSKKKKKKKNRLFPFPVSSFRMLNTVWRVWVLIMKWIRYFLKLVYSV